MNNMGITTQYGLLLQYKAFILSALESAGTKQTFTFEGEDDIEISTNESVYSVKSADASYIQIRSGTISESCFCKVTYNWFLFDKEPSGTVTLFAENQLDALVSNTTKDTILDYIIQGKEKKRSLIAWKTYNKFQNLIGADREVFLGIIEKFLQIINIHICSMDEPDSRLEEVFFENYCRDITEYQLAKSKRLERFIPHMNQEMDNALKAQRPCTPLFADLMKMITIVCGEISDHRYIAKIPELKKRVKSKATQLVKDNAIREVRQLYPVDKHDESVVDGIAHELVYEDLRDVYISQKEVEIIDPEQNAYEGYMNAELSLNEPESSSPKKVYQRTVEMPIGDSLISDGPVCREGCYILLTGNDTTEGS